MQLKIDLHVHTCCSHDSLITPKELFHYAKKRGLDGVAVTDHDIIDCALKLAKETDFLVIPGVEVSSLHGHVLGLNLNIPIPSRLSVDETVDMIHEAGGLAVAPHPTAFFKGSLKEHVNSKFDAIEVINSSAFPFNYSTGHNLKLASKLDLPHVAGSDAHYGPEIGYAYTLVNAESEVVDVIKAISKGFCSPSGSAIPLTTRLKKELLILKRKI